MTPTASTGSSPGGCWRTRPGEGAQARFDGWIAANERHVKFSSERLAELQATGARDFTTLAVAVREIRKLRRLLSLARLAVSLSMNTERAVKRLEHFRFSCIHAQN